MTKVRFVPNRKGLSELRRSAAVQEVCQEQANSCLASLGEGFTSAKRTYSERCGVVMYAETHKAWRKVIQDNVLLKVIGGG